MNKDIFSEEVKVFTPDVFEDYRGELWTTWKKDEYPITIKFLRLVRMLLEVYMEILNHGNWLLAYTVYYIL